MATKDGLKASGLLYEGSDFAEWLKSLTVILKQHFPGIALHNIVSPGTSSRHEFKLPAYTSPSDVHNCIWWHVSPYIRSRVSKPSRQTPGGLLDALRATAHPFRFMDLPPEIRLRVYHHCFDSSVKASHTTLTILRTSFPFTFKDSSLTEPPISRVSRQIRIESLAGFYKRYTIDLKFGMRIRSERRLAEFKAPLRPGVNRKTPTNEERLHAVSEWAARLKPDSMRLLRKISVQLPLLAICQFDSSEDMLHFSLVSADGKLVLNVKNHAWLKPSSNQLLSDHAAAISKLAQTLKVKGEALIMVLTSRPDIWDRLELVVK